MRRHLFALCALVASTVTNELWAQQAVPQQEAQFCSIVEKAVSEYDRLLQPALAAIDSHNELRVKQLDDSRTAIYRSMRDDVFTFALRNNFQINRWLVTVSRIRAPITACHRNVGACIPVEVHPVCSEKSVINLFVAVGDTTLRTLSDKESGSQLIVGGSFVANKGGPKVEDSPVLPRSPENFSPTEGSMSEEAAMAHPTYSADVTLVGAAAARAQGAATAAYDCTGGLCRQVALYPTWDACEQKKANGQICGAPDQAAAVTQVAKGVEMYKGGYPQQRYANMESCMSALASMANREGWSCVSPGQAVKQDHPGDSIVMYRCMVKACTAVRTFAAKAECEAALPSQPKDDFDYTCGTLGNTWGPAPTASPTPLPAASGAQPKMLNDSNAVAAIRNKIKPCWSFHGYGDAVVVSLIIQMNRDGTPASAKVQDADRYNKETAYRAAADSAWRAVMNPRCQPWPLDPVAYEQWQTIKMTFNTAM